MVKPSDLLRPFTWALGEIREKLDVRETWREIKAMSRKYGVRFGIFAVIWEITEDVVLPIIAWKLGFPWLAPLFWVFHFEPITWPAAIWSFRMWDRFMGREPWDPDRSAKSAYWRTGLKVTSHQAVTLVGAILLMQAIGLELWVLGVYIVLMCLACFFHERIWHDSNYGITEDDQVENKRNLWKAITFRVVSFSVLGMALAATVQPFPYVAFLSYEAIMALAYLGQEGLWANSSLGIEPTETT